MKKIRLLSLLIMIITSAIILLVGCKKNDTVVSVSIKDHDPEAVIEIDAGAFDYGAYTLIVTYGSGNTEELALTKDMISDADLGKLYQAGDHDIAVVYAEHECTLKVSVRRSAFVGLAFPEDTTFTYDGSAHAVELEGNIPANAVINYVGGNSFVDVGTYSVTAVVSCEGYATERISTTVTIERAQYDMSGVKFEAKEFVYDGQAHSVAISGELPKGISSPTYYIGDKKTASATDAGEYEVVARFSVSDPNYEPIPDMKTTLTITPREYSVSGLSIVFKTEGGKVIDGTTKVYDGESVLFDLSDRSSLSTRISVLFSVTDKDGNEISTSNTETGIENVGVYTVTVNFTHADGKNYQPIEPLVYTFEILKAEHPTLTGVSLVSNQTVYDGLEHFIEIEGELPEGVRVKYEYYLGSELLTDEEGNPVRAVTDAGIYTVKAVFTHDDENHGGIKDLSATLNIKKAEIDISLVGFGGLITLEYTGGAHEQILKTWAEINRVDYDMLGYTSVKYYVFDTESGAFVAMADGELPTDVGIYKAAVDISINEEFIGNYVLPGEADALEIVKRFEIVAIKLADPSVSFITDAERDYSGDEQGIDYTHTASELMTVSTLYYKYEAGKAVALEAGELPVDAGSYKFVVTLSISDTKHYVFKDGADSREFSFEFEIKPLTIDVGSIALGENTFTYNGEAQQPRLILPAHASAATEIYRSSGTAPIAQAINAGKYRIKVELSPESSNYVLSSNIKPEFEFEIKPIYIEVSGLLFDDDSFEYDGQRHQPELTAALTNVRIGEDLYAITGIMQEEVHVDEAVKAGKYRYYMWIAPINSNYALLWENNAVADQVVEYTVDFEITINSTVIADTDELKDLLIEIPYKMSYADYNWEDDDPSLAAAIGKVIYGEYADYAECTLSSIRDTEANSFVANVGGAIKADTVYEIKIRLTVNDDRYSIYHENRYTITVNTFSVKVRLVESSQALDAPEVVFTGESRVEYDGSGVQIEYTATADPELCDVSAAYFMLVGDEYLAIDGIPKDAGSYKMVVTVSIKDAESYAFPDGETAKEFAFELEISPIEIDVSQITLSHSSASYNGDSHLPTVEGVPERVSAEISIYPSGEAFPAESMINAGKYRIVLTLAPESSNYVLSPSSELEFEFEISPIEIDVSQITLSHSSAQYNGESHLPTVEGVPERVSAEISIYPSGEAFPAESMINAGKYRIVLTLAPESSNYVLSPSSVLEFEFEITPIEIDVSGVFFDSLTFEYDENPHKPELVNLPENVVVSTDMYFISGQIGDWPHVDEAVKVGRYRYYVRIGAASSNYVIAGQNGYVKEYVVEFEIKTDLIVVLNTDTLNSLLIEIPYDESYADYNWQDDDPSIAAAIGKVIYGEYADYAECNVSRIKDAEANSYVANGGAIKADTVYEIKIQLTVKENYQHKYRIYHSGDYVLTVNDVILRVKLASAENA